MWSSDFLGVGKTYRLMRPVGPLWGGQETSLGVTHLHVVQRLPLGVVATVSVFVLTIPE